MSFPKIFVNTWILMGTVSLLPLLAGCGVKGPPIAPTRIGTPPPQVLNCSPYDPKCDETASDYVPGLNLNNPEDAAKIRALEAEQRNKAKKSLKK